MINLSFRVLNPFSKATFRLVYVVSGVITRNKSWEFEIYKYRDLVNIAFEWTTATDHAGVKLSLGVFGYLASFTIYDNRHWNTEKDTWNT